MAKNSLEIFTAIDWNHPHYFSSSHLLMSPTHPHLSLSICIFYRPKSLHFSNPFQEKSFFFSCSKSLVSTILLASHLKMAFRTGLSLLHLLVALALLSSLVIVKGESPYKFYTWTVTYGIIYPLGVPQQVQSTQQQFLLIDGLISLFCLFDANTFFKLFIDVLFFSQVILINGQFPGPKLDVVTNDNIILNLINKLDQPFLLTW